MSEGVYIKTFGAYGVPPVKIWPNKKNGKVIEWKQIEKKMKNGEKYIEQYGLFKFNVAVYDGKDKNNKAKYKYSNTIYVKVRDINLYNLFIKMLDKNAKYYSFYGSIVVESYHTITTIAKDKDGNEVKYKNGETIKTYSISIEWCSLEDPNFKLVPVFQEENDNMQQSDEIDETDNIVDDKIPDEHIDDDIPF